MSDQRQNVQITFVNGQTLDLRCTDGDLEEIKSAMGQPDGDVLVLEDGNGRTLIRPQHVVAVGVTGDED